MSCGMRRHWPDYQIDPVAGVIIGRRGKPVGRVNRSGYLVIDRRSHGSGQQLAHRMIWESVNGPIAAGFEINHLNGDKLDNRIENLELVTRAENVRHAFRIGLKSNAGEKHPGAQLTWAAVQTIRARYVRYSRHANAAALAREYGVTRKCIADVVLGHTWKEAAP